MKNRIIYILTLLAVSTLFLACEEQTTPEANRVQHPSDLSPLVRDNAYYQRLRAYKQTDHKLSFGWYGSWTAIGPSNQCRMSSTPDSMDIISLWSQWWSLTDAQMKDKEFVQKVRGTKVVFCISAKDVPAIFKEEGVITEASLVAYAKAWGKDSMDKYQYDGMDIDFETASDHQGPLSTNPALFKKFCQELSQYIGPASGTGRLFLIDGNLESLAEGIAELCNYGVSQAYNSSGSRDLISRTATYGRRGFKAENLIFTENFESKWQTGGVNFLTTDGKTMESLLGMAYFAAHEGSRGFGSYHMEYEYGHADMPYKYIRRAIQIANPAPQGDYTKTLVTMNEAGEQTFNFIGTGSVTTINLTGRISTALSTDTDIPFMIDNSLIAPYNEYYYTEYKAIDLAHLSFSGPLHFPANTLRTDAPVVVTIDVPELEHGEYLIPIVVDFNNMPTFSANTEKKILYLIIKKTPDPSKENILENVTSVPGVLINDMTGWKYSINDMNGVGGFTDQSIMFNNNAGEQGWSISAEGSRTITVDMNSSRTITGWRIGLPMGSDSFKLLKLFDIQTSTDNLTWKNQSDKSGISLGAPVKGFQYVAFDREVTCRYIRMTYKMSSDSSVGFVCGSSEFNAYAPNN